MTSVLEGKPSNVAREAELLGKMREVDLFVRTGDVQVGIFATLLDNEAAAAMDATTAGIDDYQD